MEKMMLLKGVSPVMSRQFPDKQTGATVTINWVELTLTDGVASASFPSRRQTSK